MRKCILLIDLLAIIYYVKHEILNRCWAIILFFSLPWGFQMIFDLGATMKRSCEKPVFTFVWNALHIVFRELQFPPMLFWLRRHSVSSYHIHRGIFCFCFWFALSLCYCGDSLVRWWKIAWCDLFCEYTLLSLLCSPRLHACDQKHSKNSNILLTVILLAFKITFLFEHILKCIFSIM